MNNKFKCIGFFTMIFACVMISGCATSNNSEVEKATKEDEIGVNGATEVGKAEGGVDSNIIVSGK